MLKCFAQFCVALLDLLEQPHVLDGDDRLGGERFEKLDLFLCKWADLQPANRNHSNWSSLAQQRCRQYRPNADPSSKARSKVIFWQCCQVINVKGSPVNCGTAGYRVTVYWQ